MGNVKKKGVRKHPPSPADQADAEAINRSVQTMIDGPLSEWDHKRPLGSLNRDDLKILAVACVTGWVLEKAKQSCAPNVYDPISDAVSAE